MLQVADLVGLRGRLAPGMKHRLWGRLSVFQVVTQLIWGSVLYCLASSLGLSRGLLGTRNIQSFTLLPCRSLLERILRMRLVYAQPAMTRALSFEYLNRQLVWHELSELLLFLLPLLNVGAVKRFLTQRLRPPSTTAIASGVGLVVR